MVVGMPPMTMAFVLDGDPFKKSRWLGDLVARLTGF
jgi:hypothetical protein